MTDCPYCHNNTTVRYSPVVSLHLVRSLIGSDKRYCSQCQKKWKVRSHRKRLNASFYAVALPLTLLFSLGIFRITDGRARASMSSGNIAGGQVSGGGSLQTMILGAAVSTFMGAKNIPSKGNSQADLSGLSGNQRKLAEKALKNLSPDAIQAKLKKLESNPQALSKLSGERKEVVEQALKMMKKQKH